MFWGSRCKDALPEALKKLNCCRAFLMVSRSLRSSSPAIEAWGRDVLPGSLSFKGLLLGASCQIDGDGMDAAHLTWCKLQLGLLEPLQQVSELEIYKRKGAPFSHFGGHPEFTRATR